MSQDQMKLVGGAVVTALVVLHIAVGPVAINGNSPQTIVQSYSRREGQDDDGPLSDSHVPIQNATVQLNSVIAAVTTTTTTLPPTK